MNIEIANRLVELRKKSGYSQETLAAKLGISRQAVSKWERAEASPDTDNLITLSRLYGISLDELLKSEDEADAASGANAQEASAQENSAQENTAEGNSAQENTEEGNSAQENSAQDNNGDNNKQEENAKEAESKDNGEYVHIGFNGIHVKDGKEEVHIGWNGVHVHDKSKNGKHETVDIDRNGVFVNGEKIHGNFHIDEDGVFVNGKRVGENGDIFYNGKKTTVKTQFLRDFPVGLIITVAYLIIGLVYGWWHPGWLLFFLVPIIHSIFDAVERKKVSEFSYTVFATLIFLCLGFFGGLWSIAWVVFLTIPIFYSLCRYFRRLSRRNGEYIYIKNKK